MTDTLRMHPSFPSRLTFPPGISLTEPSIGPHRGSGTKKQNKEGTPRCTPGPSALRIRTEHSNVSLTRVRSS
ncbi:hypothetical protein EVAR_51580_1 [Eumeta japonica]|uniref:Uncharacterized protein n=1 Tax=Eumeta variegata TaxID=151549 RepID=A0A4C1YJZ4_EUMVA|nr:hypothetical protein EVAR_51580_1 [Eumeta japonica]